MSDRTQIAVHSRSRCWTDNAIRLIQADARRSADTHLLRYPLPSAWSTDVEVALYLKDETTHITGSLKHRLARSTGPAEALLEFECSSVLNRDTAIWPADGPVR